MALTKLSLDQQDSRIFNTVALMVASTKLNVGERVRTLGHASLGNGGGNDYEIVAAGTGTHDNGSYIDLTGSGLQAKGLFPQQPINVLQFGAVGDGATDDTAAIQAALDSGKLTITIPDGQYVVSSVLTVPKYVSLIGSGTSISTDTGGTIILYSGTGECIRCAGTILATNWRKNRLADFRIRKTTQASTRAAIALIANLGTTVYNVRIDTNGAWNFDIGIVVDESQFTTIENCDIEGGVVDLMTAGVYYTNGDTYTTSPISVGGETNTNRVVNTNFNSPNYGIVHDGGEGFFVTGGNFNGCHKASLRLAGLNEFSIDTIYAENTAGAATSMVADIEIAQTTLEVLISTAAVKQVGSGGGGTIKNSRLASVSDDCISFTNASVQSAGHSIFGNKFGSGRTGSAVATTLADGIRDSWIGSNVNLGGSGKRYLDANVYLNNTIVPTLAAQSEDMETAYVPGGKINSTGSGRRVNVTAYTRVTGTPYVVLDTDDQINITNNAGAALTFTLPTGADQDGREITVTQVVGTDDTTINGILLSAPGESATIRYDHANTTWNTISVVTATNTTTWDPGSIADGDEEAKEITVTGAVLGDLVLASFSLDVQDLVLRASVTAADTVTAILANNTGGAIDLGSGTLKAKIIK